MSATDDTSDLRKQAKSCLRKGQYAEAVRLFQEIIDTEPGNVAAHEGLAAAYFALQDYQPAVETFLKVTRLDPKQARALVNLGAVYNRMGEYNKALDILRRGLQKDRSCAQGYYNMGLAHRGLNQSAMAVSAYREAIRLDPEMAEAHQNLGNVFVDMKNYQQAIRHYETALQLQPGFQRALNGLKIAQQAIEQEQQAASPFGRLVGSSETMEKPLSAESIRTMTDEERQYDRAAVAGIARDIERTATELAEHLRKKVEPSLLALNRTVSQGEKAAFSVVDASEKFEVCAEKTSMLRDDLQQHMQQLQEHAASVRPAAGDGS